MASQPLLTSATDGDKLLLSAAGAWTAMHAGEADRLVGGVGALAAKVRKVVIDAAQIEAIDTFGAWLLERLIRDSVSRGQTAELVGLPSHYRGLVDELHQANRTPGPASGARGRLVRAADAVFDTLSALRDDLANALGVFGAAGAALARVAVHPRGFRLTSAVHHLDRVGWQAIGIILLITLLIGGIIAQQGIFHFRKFGAGDYVVDLVGILVLREIGVLIVAIMVAGRSGSAYTAELGSMKMREEIDALRTMGLDPVEILILPRIIALVIALPILTFLGSMAALFGGGVVAWLYDGMSPLVFLARLREAISVTHFGVGMIKAPFMALVIGIVACSEGLRVKGSAESLGLKTTTSVVKSIFMVIVLDGLFAVFFASIGM
jgi:phospholipid/cholesterol/gamma-HCH transport system permease protein